MADYATELLRRQLHGMCVCVCVYVPPRTSLPPNVHCPHKESPFLPPLLLTHTHTHTYKQKTELNKNPPEGVSVGLVDDSIFEWELLLVGPADTLYEGGFFKARLKFPPEFPNMPPTMTFQTEMWHPNGA